MSYNEYNCLINNHDGLESFCMTRKLLKKYSGLPVHLRIDDTSYYQYEEFGNQNKKFIIIQNNYDNDDFDWQKGLDVLLMTISDDPQICLSDAVIKLKEEDIEIIRQFVIKYKEELKSFAEQTDNFDYDKWYNENIKK